MPSYLKFKGTVKAPAVVIIAAGIINAANQLGFTGDLTITSCNDSTHLPGSAHYTDEACDVRSHDRSPADKHALLKAIQQRLGDHYYVVLEDEGGSNEHIHAQVAQAYRAH